MGSLLQVHPGLDYLPISVSSPLLFTSPALLMTPCPIYVCMCPHMALWTCRQPRIYRGMRERSVIFPRLSPILLNCISFLANNLISHFSSFPRPVDEHQDCTWLWVSLNFHFSPYLLFILTLPSNYSSSSSSSLSSSLFSPLLPCILPPPSLPFETWIEWNRRRPVVHTSVAFPS